MGLSFHKGVRSTWRENRPCRDAPLLHYTPSRRRTTVAVSGSPASPLRLGRAQERRDETIPARASSVLTWPGPACGSWWPRPLPRARRPGADLVVAIAL